MRTFANIILVSFFGLISFLGFVSNDKTVCPTTATIESGWTVGSIYDITFSDECPMLMGKEVLLSVPLFDAVVTIKTDDNTAYGDYAIEYKYVPSEGIYIANLIDEFVEL